MGLMDKFKNLFTDEEIIEDEEDDEVEIKEVKKEENKLPTFMREKLLKDEQKKEVSLKKTDVEQDVEVKKDIKLEKRIDEEPFIDNKVEEKTFKFPIDLGDNDFTETRVSRQSLHAQKKDLDVGVAHSNFTHQEIKERPNPSLVQPKKELKVSEIYKDKKPEVKKEDKRFRATPIISPIYGVLDKNYSSVEVEKSKGRNFENNRPSKSVDFDSVRKKAYGNLSDEIKENLMCENCEYLKEVKECREREEKYHSLENDEYSSNEIIDHDITMDEAAENYFDYGVPYEKQPEVEQNQENYYLDDDNEEHSVTIVNHEEEEKEVRKKEIPPVKSSINLLSTLKKSMGEEEETKDKDKDKNLELTDDLFNLIDSMYDEGNEG